MTLARTRLMRRPAGEGPRGGFTIMELMVVMLIMGLVLGAGIGVFASFDPGSSAARGLVANALRQARNEAVAHRAPARVAFDPETGSMRSEGYRVVGTWRFEEESLPGAGGVRLLSAVAKMCEGSSANQAAIYPPVIDAPTWRFSPLKRVSERCSWRSSKPP